MRRPPIIRALILAVVLALLTTAGVTARKPVALGIASQSSPDLASVDVITASLGARPATWTIWSTWGDRGGRWACIEGLGTCSFPKGLARGLRDKGITPIIYWQPTDPSDPGRGRFERFRRITLGKHDAYIRDWARAAKAYGGPVVVRFAHEMNGNWFPWSLLNFDNSPATFQAAWRHIIRQFRAVGARNVKFLFSPFQRCGTCSAASYAEFYPGNAFVDYVGVSAINWGDTQWTSLAGLIDPPLTELRALTRTARRPLGKPVILPEIASHYSGGDKAGWLLAGYQGARQTWPAIVAMVYFDYDMTFAAQPDWRLIQPADGSAFRAYQALAADPGFRASMPPRPRPGTGRWRLMPTAKQAADDAITHIVAQDGTGEYPTIGAALAAAADGYTILVRPGTYDESLNIDKAVTIRGNQRRGPVVISPSTSAAFTLAGSSATLADLTLRGPLATVTILGGAPTLRGLHFEAAGVASDGSPGLAAISVVGGSTATLSGNTITGGATGLSVIDSMPLVEGNSISGNVTGLQVGGTALPTLTGNQICGNVADVDVLSGSMPPDRRADAVCP
jgi:parallel beta-helix repeat protein